MMLMYNDEGGCKRELEEEEERDSSLGMGMESGDCWGEIVEMRPMGGGWDGQCQGNPCTLDYTTNPSVTDFSVM